MEIHGHFTTLLRELTAPQTPRSFASKYLHFHCPDVPIYDSVALAALTSGWPLHGVKQVFELPDVGDAEYYACCRGVWLLWQDVVGLGLQPTVKQLDHFLWRRKLRMKGKAA